jgi:hypothetical protein
LALKQWQIQVDQAFSEDAEFEGASELARLSGCDIGEARQFMTQLPGIFPHRLYRHQALGLVRSADQGTSASQNLAFRRPASCRQFTLDWGLKR